MYYLHGSIQRISKEACSKSHTFSISEMPWPLRNHTVVACIEYKECAAKLRGNPRKSERKVPYIFTRKLILPLPGTVNWKLWTLCSPSVHLFILIVCFVLVFCDLWPSTHHKKIKKLSLGARLKIKQVARNLFLFLGAHKKIKKALTKKLKIFRGTRKNQVIEENWDKLLVCAKDLIDARLEDGKE